MRYFTWLRPLRRKGTTAAKVTLKFQREFWDAITEYTESESARLGYPVSREAVLTTHALARDPRIRRKYLAKNPTADLSAILPPPKEPSS